MTIFKGEWNSIIDICNDFEIDDSDLDNYIVLLATYSYEDYNGDAFVLLQDKSNGQLYEVNAGHCSCYGLEGQWELEETSCAALKYRIEKGTLGHDSNGIQFEEDLLIILDAFCYAEYPYVVVRKAMGWSGYFIGPTIDMFPNLPNLKTSSCLKLEQAVELVYVPEDMEDLEENSFSTNFIKNPAIARWHEEGVDHIVTVRPGQYRYDDQAYLSRLVEIPCKRLDLHSAEEILLWIKENDGEFVEGSRYNLRENTIILCE